MYDGGPNYSSNGGMNPVPGGPVNALTINDWIKQHWKLLIIIIVGVILLGLTIYQIVYPGSRLIPGTVVDGISIGGLRKDDAAKKINDAYGGLTLDIYFGKNDAAFQSPKMSEVGIGVDNTDRLASLDYPFYLRIIPGSIFWATGLQKLGDITYTYDKNKIADYTQSKVGSDCSIPPQNASLKLVDSQLQLIPSATGGKCDITEFQQSLAEVQPSSDKANSVRIAIDETPAPISDDMARDLAAKLNGRLAVPMPISVDAATDTIPGRIVLSWLDFKADVPEQTIDNSSNQQASLKYSVNQKRMEAYLNQGIAAKLVKKPGVSKVSTLDFTETSRVNGANGRAMDMPKAVQSVEDYIAGKRQTAVGATIVVGPTTVYTRSYTPTSVGFRALLTQYAQDNPGTWGLAFTELSGVRFPRSASYNADARMKAGGIHSIYLAYTDVIQEYAGIARPVDIISGDTNAATCFKLMLQRSDTGCIKGFYNYFGFATLTARAKDLGVTNTVFIGDDTVTSANDLQKVMVGLYKNQIGRVEGAQKIISTMRTSRDNDGIPAGAGAGEISHIVGETDTIHNDTAIVYSTNYGAYALTVLSDGSSWDKIAGLTKKIQALKAVKIPTNAR
jgi:beta-lactamase class A